MTHQLIQYFKFDHLPEPLQEVSEAFHDLAVKTDEGLKDGSEKSVALRKLLEAKDAAVRSAAIDGLPE